MKISKNILHLPPYISTPWKNISSLYVDKSVLKVVLTSGTTVEIPGLDKETLTTVFNGYAHSLDEETPSLIPSLSPTKEQVLGFKIPINLDGGLNTVFDLIQHNSDQMNTPSLPKEILSKIATMAQAVGMDSSLFPNPEPHCNCPHCQMARAIHQNEKSEQTREPEEVISEEDLRFRDWEIVQTSEKLYRVTNPLNQEEHFNVFLGEPVGCTCGEKNCDHIRAVLRS